MVFWAQRFSSTFRGRNAMTNCSWWWAAAKAIKVTSNCLEASTSSSSRRVRKNWWVNWWFLNDGLMGSLYLFGGWPTPLKIWKSVGMMKFPVWWVNGFMNGLILMGSWWFDGFMMGSLYLFGGWPTPLKIWKSVGMMKFPVWWVNGFINGLILMGSWWFHGLMMVNWWVYDRFFIFIWLVVVLRVPKSPMLTNTKWSSMTWMITGVPSIFWEHLHVFVSHL